MNLSVVSEAVRRQCIEDQRRSFFRVQCTNEAVYGFYCAEHGAPPLSGGDGGKSRKEKGEDA